MCLYSFFKDGVFLLVVSSVSFSGCVFLLTVSFFWQCLSSDWIIVQSFFWMCFVLCFSKYWLSTDCVFFLTMSVFFLFLVSSITILNPTQIFKEKVSFLRGPTSIWCTCIIYLSFSEDIMSPSPLRWKYSFVLFEDMMLSHQFISGDISDTSYHIKATSKWKIVWGNTQIVNLKLVRHSSGVWISNVGGWCCITN